MDPSDEELIRKFAGLHTEDTENASTVSIPLSATSSRNWELCLLAKVCTDRAVFDSQFEKQMRRLWEISPGASFKQMDKGLYLIQLTGKDEVMRVLNEGPWVYRQDLVAISQCDSTSQLNRAHIKHGELWVQFHNVPTDYLTEEGVKMITSAVGMPLSDPISATMKGRQFIKLKMLIPLDQPMKDKVRMMHPVLGQVLIYLVYERVGRICLFCGTLGHEMGTCSERIRLARIRSKIPANTRPDLEAILKKSRGSWVTNPNMVPVGGECGVAGSHTENGLRAQGGAGLKRAINEILTDLTSWENNRESPIAEASQNQHQLPQVPISDDSALTATKRPKAARP